MTLCKTVQGLLTATPQCQRNDDYEKYHTHTNTHTHTLIHTQTQITRTYRECYFTYYYITFNLP